MQNPAACILSLSLWPTGWLTHSRDLQPAAGLPLRRCEPCVQITWLSGIDRRAHPFGTVPIFPSSAHSLTQSRIARQHKNRPPPVRPHPPPTPTHTYRLFRTYFPHATAAASWVSRAFLSWDVDSLVCETWEGNLRLAAASSDKVQSRREGACKVEFPRARSLLGNCKLAARCQHFELLWLAQSLRR